MEPFLSEHLTTAAKDGISIQEALLDITNREISLRNQRAAQIQVSVSHFPYVKTIDEFDFHFQTSVSKSEIKDLATLRFLENKEIGYLPVDKTGANLLFQLIAKRYEHNSTIITTNQPFSKWGDVFSDSMLANAILKIAGKFIHLNLSAM